jgi:hypothetical protein
MAALTASPMMVCWKWLEPKSSPAVPPIHRKCIGRLWRTARARKALRPVRSGHNLVDDAATMISAARIGSAVRRGTVNIAAGI